MRRGAQLDGSGHISCQLTPDIVTANDIVVALDPEESAVLGRKAVHMAKVPTTLTTTR